jgi:hypothetical protein
MYIFQFWCCRGADKGASCSFCCFSVHISDHGTPHASQLLHIGYHINPHAWCRMSEHDPRIVWSCLGPCPCRNWLGALYFALPLK